VGTATSIREADPVHSHGGVLIGYGHVLAWGVTKPHGSVGCAICTMLERLVLAANTDVISARLATSPARNRPVDRRTIDW